jgi:hypothetical protein
MPTDPLPRRRRPAPATGRQDRRGDAPHAGPEPTPVEPRPLPPAFHPVERRRSRGKILQLLGLVLLGTLGMVAVLLGLALGPDITDDMGFTDDTGFVVPGDPEQPGSE